MNVRICIVAVALAASTLSGQTVTVTTVEDAVDIPSNGTVANLPGPDGRVSFREALIVTNTMPGAQTIAFAIPTEEWWFDSNVATLKLVDGIFFVTDDDTTLDFASQTAVTGDTNPAGREVGIFGLQPNGWGLPAITIYASDCVVEGLGPVDLRRAAVEIAGGTNNRIIDCTTSIIEIDGSDFNVIGGTLPGEGNVLEEVEIQCSSHDNVVIGNQLEAVSIVASQYCDRPERNRIGGPTAAERNVIAGTGSYSGEGFPLGQNINIEWGLDTLVEGNYIGVTADGLTRVPQVAPTGVRVVDSINTVVRDNLIAGMYVVGQNHYAGELFGRAIQITAINNDTLGVSVTGNLVGTDVTGSAGILTLNGILVDHLVGTREVRDVTIGGLDVGDANTVAFTERRGIAVLGANVEAKISGNSIHGNGLLGIDLASFFSDGDGVTPNDVLDVDNGGNTLQNTPMLTAVTRVGAVTRIEGVLSSSADDTFAVEFFASPTCDDSGSGEGEVFYGAIEVTTDGNGEVAFDALLDGVPPTNWVFAATATHLAEGATSEFSACASTVWSDEGHALAGVAGAPRLLGVGSLAAGEANQLLLSSAAPNALAALFIGFAGAPQPFKSGVLMPVLVGIDPLVLTTTTGGAIDVPFTMPAGVPASTELWLQWAVEDVLATKGVSLSNALMGRTP